MEIHMTGFFNNLHNSQNQTHVSDEIKVKITTGFFFYGLRVALSNRTDNIESQICRVIHVKYEVLF